jgi:putative endonuclease
MSEHLKIGKMGENAASLHLSKMGFTIICRNWRYKHWELDIVAEKEDVLHFIEVKTRSSEYFGLPEENVSDHKMDFITRAAELFMEDYEPTSRIQFDIISVILKKNHPADFFLIEDVYF